MEQGQTRSHSELEQYHYQALRNPLYLAEGLADVLREDLMMVQQSSPQVNMPILSQTQGPVEQVIIHRHSDMSKENYDLLQQAWRKINWLQKKLEEQEKKTKNFY